jgi:hypothetical protein
MIAVNSNMLVVVRRQVYQSLTSLSKILISFMYSDSLRCVPSRDRGDRDPSRYHSMMRTVQYH